MQGKKKKLWGLCGMESLISYQGKGSPFFKKKKEKTGGKGGIWVPLRKWGAHDPRFLTKGLSSCSTERKKGGPGKNYLMSSGNEHGAISQGRRGAFRRSPEKKKKRGILPLGGVFIASLFNFLHQKRG